jgi:hypothetical protein
MTRSDLTAGRAGRNRPRWEGSSGYCALGDWRARSRSQDMSGEFAGRIELDIRDSEPDWGPFAAPTAPAGAPNVLYLVWDDVGMPPGLLRRTGRHAEHEPDAERGYGCRSSQHGAVLTDPGVVVDRAQPDVGGAHHRGSPTVSELQRPDPVRHGAISRCWLLRAGTPTAWANGISPR